MSLTEKINKLARANIKKGPPSSFIFFITNVCNLKCEHCFYHESLNTKISDLSLEEIKKCSMSLGEINNINFSGGEPFIRKDIDEIVDIFYTNNNLKFLLIPTNGSFQDKVISKVRSMLDKCPDLYLTILTSLDGLEETHNNIREGKSGPGESFNKALATIHELQEMQKNYPKLNLVVNSVVHNKNVDEIIALNQRIKKEFGFNIGVSMYRGGGFGEELRHPDQEEWQSIMSKVRENGIYNGRNYDSPSSLIENTFYAHRTDYIDHINSEYIEGKASPFECGAGQHIFVLDHNGGVKVCENYDSFANIRDYDYDFKALWKTEIAKKEFLKVKQCFCIHPCFLNNSLTYKVDNYMHIEAFKLREKLGLVMPGSKKRIVHS